MHYNNIYYLTTDKNILKNIMLSNLFHSAMFYYWVAQRERQEATMLSV